MLSIIIPTLNEEKYLPVLLESVFKNSLDDFEIIIADNNSEDRTKEIAKIYGCKIVQGGLPAKGRNQGTLAARGDLLLFLDADIILANGFFEKSLKEFKERSLCVASYCLIPNTKNIALRRGFNVFYNWPIMASEKTLAYGAMAIMVKKEVFEKAGGFNEKINLAEDHHFVRQARKFGKFGIIRSTHIIMTMRRFERDGYLNTFLKYFFCNLQMIFRMRATSGVFKYKFGHYSSPIRSKQKEV
ncbi:MAG: glycosyltransferase [Candidatus Nealsonbacteria bacterium]